MQGPSAIALRQGGQGGALKYKVGVQVVVTIASGGVTPPSWKKKTTLQEVFGDFGQVLEIHTQDDGTAIVEFEDQRDAQDASQSLDGKKILGTTVNVKIRQDGRMGGCIRGGTDDRITELAMKYGLDATSTARLVSAFRDRSRRGCNLDVDLKQLGEHLSASNKPSALVCMKLADLRDGKPIGPCRFNKEMEDRKKEQERQEREAAAGQRREPREPREPRETREAREPREPREPRDAKEPRETRDGDKDRGRRKSRSRSRRQQAGGKEEGRDRERRDRERRDGGRRDGERRDRERRDGERREGEKQDSEKQDTEVVQTSRDRSSRDQTRR